MHSDLNSALKCLQNAEVIIYPTETLFGMGVDPGNEKAVETLLKLKARPSGKGLLLIIDSVDKVFEWAEIKNNRTKLSIEVLLEQFWPGPLTIVFKAKPVLKQQFARGVFSSDGTIAVRYSSNETAIYLAENLGGAIVSTSVNPKDKIPARTIQEVKQYFPDLRCVRLEQVESSNKLDVASTIVDVQTYPFKILREGQVATALRDSDLLTE